MAWRSKVEFREGIFEGIPFEEYAKVQALNGSSIVHMRRSAMYFKHMRDNPPAATDAQLFGIIVHRLILEPHAQKDIAVWGREKDQKVRRGKVWNKFLDGNTGKEIMSVAEHEAALRMSVCALAHHPIARYANAEGPTEISMFWRHPVSGRRHKARLDKLIPEKHTIFDLKSTVNCHSQQFCRQSYNFGYHIKMAHYAQGYEILTGKRPRLVLGAIEKKAPHESAVYRVTDDVLQQGWEELDQLVLQLDECERSGRWPAQHEDETDLLLPAWLQYEQADSYEEESA
jgi:hypothetical protein